MAHLTTTESSSMSLSKLVSLNVSVPLCKVRMTSTGQHCGDS